MVPASRSRPCGRGEKAKSRQQAAMEAVPKTRAARAEEGGAPEDNKNASKDKVYENGKCTPCLPKGNSKERRIARLKRDKPEAAQRLEHGEFKSVAAASGSRPCGRGRKERGEAGQDGDSVTPMRAGEERRHDGSGVSGQRHAHAGGGGKTFQLGRGAQLKSRTCERGRDARRDRKGSTLGGAPTRAGERCAKSVESFHRPRRARAVGEVMGKKQASGGE